MANDERDDAKGKKNDNDKDRGHGSTASVIVDSPVGDVYEFWRKMENLPRVLSEIEEVRPTGPESGHWVVKGPFGAVVEFDVRMTRNEPEELVAWESASEGQELAGEVHFEEVGPDVTRVELSTGPGKAKSSLSSALRRFRKLVEGPDRAATEKLLASPDALAPAAPHRKGTSRQPGSDHKSSYGSLIAGPHFDDPLPEELLKAFEGSDEGLEDPDE